MKSLHRPDLYSWSAFDPERNIDFNSVAWVRPGGNVLIDPLPLTQHDLRHLQSLGGAAWIVVTNSDHARAAAPIAAATGAQLAGPAAEQATFPLTCQRWLRDGDEVVPGLVALELEGSKTPGELVLLLEQTTLITGDLIRAHRAGSLTLLPDKKLKDRKSAAASVQRLLQHRQIGAVLVGDGWSLFEDGHRHLRELASRLSTG
jgi:glyoxylase-like metal-dependent hydrolase (beta-lactamase superfamily II)